MDGATLTLDDFRSHLRMLREMSDRMGGLRAFLRTMPGCEQMPGDAPLRLDERDLVRFDGVFDSMTGEERSDPDLLLDAPRRSRVARGAGLPVATVDSLLVHFYGTRRGVRKLRRS